MTYSSYLNDKELRAAADRYTEMYGGQFECADTGDVLLYRKNEGDTYISVKADYPVPSGFGRPPCTNTQSIY
jgi:hypothetical protein